jgi:tetratricopeptide (TPR) repeat protein
MKKLRIFAASPSDMSSERAKVETVAAMLKPLADNLDIALEVVDWRAVMPEMGRPQQVIFDQLRPTSWDAFIGILWHRFGTPPAGRDPQTQREYLSGTEEEFKTVFRLWQQYKKPRIMIYRCTRAVPLDALDPEQFKLVKDFFAGFEAIKGEHPGLYQSFDTTESFERLLLDNLQKLLLEYGEEIKGQPVSPEVIQAFAPKMPDNLPRRSPFFGRDQEMEIVMRALSPDDRTWGILLDGIGGIGKTAMATEAAYRCKDKGLFDAFIFISAKQNILEPSGMRELKPAARTLDEFLNETARVLGETGIAKLAGDDKRRALIDNLRGKRALLVYDNLETLEKEEQEALANFLRELPQECKAIITSRRRGGEGAVWLRLEKLEWEAARSIIESEMARDPQLARKLERVGATRWQELYDETKGSPLALMHTLGLLRVRISLTFDGALKLLRGNPDPDLQKFIFQEARKELTANDENALRALSFFIPSAAFDAWAKAADISRNALETTIDRLGSLSLVDVMVGEERYALHSLTRDFVRSELLVDKQIARVIGERFASYWVAYAQQYGGESNNYKTFHLIESEWPNLDAAAEWLWQAAKVDGEVVGDKDAAFRLNDLTAALCAATGPLFFVGRWEESLQMNARAYDAMRVLSEWSKAGWRAYQITWVSYNRANTDLVTRWLDRCAEAWRYGGSKHEQATEMRLRGLIARRQKDYNAAERLYQNALEIWRELNSDRGVVNVLNSLGGVERARKKYEAAERDYRESLALAQKLDLKEEQTFISANLGMLSLDRGLLSEAHEWFEGALVLAREIGRLDLIASSVFGLARVHEKEGRYDVALLLAQEALLIYERLQDVDLPVTKELVERLTTKMGDQ